MSVLLTRPVLSFQPEDIKKMFGDMEWLYYPNTDETVEEYAKESIRMLNNLFGFLWHDVRVAPNVKIDSMTNFGDIGNAWLKTASGSCEEGVVSLETALTLHIPVFLFTTANVDVAMKQFVVNINKREGELV